jgi:hypothetical protein
MTDVISRKIHLFNIIKRHTQCIGNSFNVDVMLWHPDDAPTSRLQPRCFSGVSGLVSMPIRTVDLQSDTPVGNQEINAVSTHLGFLDKANITTLQFNSDGSFQPVLAVKTTITGCRTKAPKTPRECPEPLAAMFALCLGWWKSARFRAKSKGTSVVVEQFPALRATSIGCQGASAFIGADSVAVGDFGGHRKLLCAYRAGLAYPGCRFVGEIAGSFAELY